MYFYTVHGLIFSSEFPCPELCSTGYVKSPDFTIRLGQTPEKLESETRKAARFSISSGQLLLQVDNVARYWVRQGNEVVIQAEPNASENEIRLFLYGTAFGAILLQQNRLPIHATTVVREGRAVLIAGTTGVGKSTLGHTFVNRGWKLLCDDVTTVEASEKGIRAHPGFPSIKLWRDVLEYTNTETSNLSSIRPDFEKYRWDANDHFCSEPAKVHALIILNSHSDPEFKIEPVTGTNKFIALTRQTYRRQFIEGMVDQRKLFITWSNILQTCPIWRVHRPKMPLQPEKLADHIESLFV